MADETCEAFDSVDEADRPELHRFVVGADPAPREMTKAEIRELGDPFARLLLSRGKFPRSGEAVVEQLRDAVPKKDPLRRRRSFVLGEGSHLASTQESAGVNRNIRFVVSLGGGPDGPDVFLSVFNPAHPKGIEVMAWDRDAGGFNYYRSSGERPMWMFGGNSRDALRDSSRGKGVFESHSSGALLMKEIKTPWSNWDSPQGNIPETAFAEGDARRKHEWFEKRDPGGAQAFELDAARPAIARWARARFERLRRRGGEVTRPRQIMEQVLGTPTVNLTSTHVENGALADSSQLDLPATFFVDSEGLSATLGLASPPAFTVTGKIYAKCLEKFDVRLDDGEGFVRKGDTHFCFLVPERAFEDQVVLREALEIGLLSRWLAASLLMVDAWNPVFSDRRQALLQHVPATAKITKGRSSFSREMAGAILAAAEKGPPGTPEAEFAERWQVGTSFKGAFDRKLKSYYDAVKAKLKTQAGFDGYFRLAEERRQRFDNDRDFPISEFSLLLPRTNVTRQGLRMREDGAVA